MPKKTIVAGVGYQYLRDMSLGPVLTQQFAAEDWPDHVTVDADFSYGPIAIVQRFKAETDLCERIVFFSAVRADRQPGTVTAYRWRGELPPPDEIQARVGEAVTGVISLENLLVVGEHFGIWPDEVFVVEVEPAEESWGDGFSRVVGAVLDEVRATIRRLALEGEI